jgi:hypothetical protein
MIHKDEKGKFDDGLVEEIIIHELRHHVQQFILGLMFYIIYAVDFMIHGYFNVWFEKDARAATNKWIRAGRPRIFNFGKRY